MFLLSEEINFRPLFLTDMNEKNIKADTKLSGKISSLESAMLGQRQLIIEQQKMIEEQENLIKEQNRVINDINNETDDGDEQTV